MAIDLTFMLPYLAFLGFAAFGATLRAVFGIYRAYNAYPDFAFEKRRVGFEILASMLFGTFAVLVLRELNVFPLGLNIAALVAGFLGADLIGLITKRLGLTKGMQVIVSRQQMENADLSEREAKALRYAHSKGRITNGIYQRISGTGIDSAKRDLGALVKKGRLSRKGHAKGTYYIPVTENRSGDLLAVYGAPEMGARKAPDKAPEGKMVCFEVKSGPVLVGASAGVDKSKKRRFLWN